MPKGATLPFGPLRSRVPKGESCFARKGRNILRTPKDITVPPKGRKQREPLRALLGQLIAHSRLYITAFSYPPFVPFGPPLTARDREETQTVMCQRGYAGKKAIYAQRGPLGTRKSPQGTTTRDAKRNLLRLPLRGKKNPPPTARDREANALLSLPTIYAQRAAFAPSGGQRCALAVLRAALQLPSFLSLPTSFSESPRRGERKRDALWAPFDSEGQRRDAKGLLSPLRGDRDAPLGRFALSLRLPLSGTQSRKQSGTKRDALWAFRPFGGTVMYVIYSETAPSGNI